MVSGDLGRDFHGPEWQRRWGPWSTCGILVLPSGPSAGWSLSAWSLGGLQFWSREPVKGMALSQAKQGCWCWEHYPLPFVWNGPSGFRPYWLTPDNLHCSPQPGPFYLYCGNPLLASSLISTLRPFLLFSMEFQWGRWNSWRPCISLRAKEELGALA